MKIPKIYTKGRGIPFIWLHGMLSSTESDSLNPMLDFDSIAKTVKVLRYNYRDKNKNADYTWTSLSEELSHIIDYNDIESPILAGLSMGTGTILHYISNFENTAKALVLVTPPPAWESREKIKKVYKKIAQKTKSDNIPEVVKKLISSPTDIPEYVIEKYPEIREKIIECRLNFEPDYYKCIYSDGAISDFPSRELISKIKIPTLIIAQTNDDNHPIETAIELNQLIKKSELFVISNFDDYTKTSSIINNFIDKECLNNNL